MVCGSCACGLRSTAPNIQVPHLTNSSAWRALNSSKSWPVPSSEWLDVDRPGPVLSPMVSLLLLPKRVLMRTVRVYQILISPWLGSSCRFEPTCSAYSLQALDTHGAAVGTCMTLHRLARCGPWCEGGHDPVPAVPPRLFRLFATDGSAHVSTPSSSSISKPNP